MKKLLANLTSFVLVLCLMPTPAFAAIVPTVIQFYGPSSWNGRLVQLVGQDWTIPTGAYTNTTKTLWIPAGELPKIRWARWVNVWTPGSCDAGVRLRVAHLSDLRPVP